MKNSIHRSWVAVAVVFLVLLVDQLSKIWVKTHMGLYDTIHITDWFKIYFVENNGMASVLKLEESFFFHFSALSLLSLLCFISRGW